MRLCLSLLLMSLLSFAPATAQEDGFKSLFDGKTLTGWRGDTKLWSVRDGAIVGKTDGKIPDNTFLIYDTPYSDFVLKAKFRLHNHKGNSGIQFRSEEFKGTADKPAEPFVIAGYQADIADNQYLGILYGEKTGRGIIQNLNADLQKKVADAINKDGWNEYIITASSDQITLVLNGVTTVDLKDPQGAKSGLIALQLHRGHDMEISFKDIQIRPITAPAAAKAPAESTLRVMSYNIRYGSANDGDNHWDHRKEDLVRSIHEFQPDLLGTQETVDFQKDFLARHLPGMEAFGVGRDDGSDKGEMMALFYRTDRFEKIDGGHFWLSETPDVPGSKSWDSSLPRMATWVKLCDRKATSDPRELWFINTHFDHRGETARREAALIIRRWIEKLPDSAAVILTGDFNAAEGSHPYVNLFGEQDNVPSPVIDAYRTRNPDRLADEGTFNGFDLTKRRGGRIDWVGCTPQWKVLEAKINHFEGYNRSPSDHYPIEVVLVPTP